MMATSLTDYALDFDSRSGMTLTFQVVDAIGRAIVRGDFKNAPFPTESELAKRFGVSRSVMREAVKMVTAKGLLVARPKAGTYLRPEGHWNLFDVDVLRWLMERRPSIELLRQFNELRKTVEPQAAAFAAERATPPQVAAIAKGLQRMRDAAEGRDDPLDADIEFHVALLQASGNPFVSQFRDIVSTALRASIRFSNQKGGGKACIPDHEAVYLAVAGGDPEKARKGMTKLIDEVLEYIQGMSAQI